MTTTRTAAPGRLLTQVAGERRTGALLVGGQPGGTVYLIEGQVVQAESPAAPGVGELLTASGRLAGRTWQNALDAGTASAQVARILLEQGHLTQGELELCVLGAIYDATYFVLSAAAATVDFIDGAAHWLGPVVAVEVAAITREARRRTRLLDEIHPDARIDSAPVSLVPRPPRERLTLTALQWELVVHADGQRTPADLAQLLGRAGYATIQELRRLAAAGLLDLPGTPVPPAVVVPPPVPDPPAAPVVTPLEAEPAEGGGTVYRPPRLARRKPGAKLPKDVAADPGPRDGPGTDEVLLRRIRTALRALR